MCVCAAQLLSAMVAKLGNMDDPLPQDSFEGVDEDEWVSECEEKLLMWKTSYGLQHLLTAANCCAV